MLIYFHVNVCLKVKTDDEKLKSKQNLTRNAVANYMVGAFNAENGPLIMVRQRDSPGKVPHE